MTHLDGDTVLKFVLETLDEPDSVRVREHLSGCEQCRQRHHELHDEIKRVEGIDLCVGGAVPPRLPRRAGFLRVSSRWAAVLAVGFLAGYVTAEVSRPVRPIPVQQRLIPVRVASPVSGYIPCQAVDLIARR